MKRILISIITLAAVFTGCNDALIEDAGYGQLSLELTASEDGYMTVVKSSANEDVNEFKIDIARVSDGTVVKSFQRFGDMEKVIQLPSGNYTLKARSPKNLPAAFDQPVYGVEHDFTIKVGEAVSEKLVCTLQNIKVSLSLSEAFLSELQSYTITASNGDGAENKLYWTNVSSEVEDEYTTKSLGRAGYFSLPEGAGNSNIKIRVDGKRKMDGSEAYHEVSLSGKAKDHFIVSIDAKVTGQSGFELTIDTDTNDRNEDVSVPGFDEDPVEGETPGSGSGSGDTGDQGGSDSGDDTPGTGDGGGGSGSDAITLEWPGNSSLSAVDIVDGMAVDLTVNAPAGIKDFTIDVTSDTQMFLFLVSKMTSTPGTIGSISSVHIDLINDATAVEKMAGVGLKTGNDIKGKTTVTFSLSSLIPMIPSAGQAGPGTSHTFKLNVTDNDGNAKSWPLTFRVPNN